MKTNELTSTFEVEASPTFPPEKIYKFFNSSKNKIKIRINKIKGI